MSNFFSPSTTDLRHLRRCVELTTEALEAGDEPFGSVLVAADGAVLAEDRNRIASGDSTRHPEFELARWAAANMTPEERAAATVYTSGEHCPMCAAAHGWVGLGRIVYASSSAQLATWLSELGVPPAPVRNLAIREVVPGLTVEGPVPELAEQVHELIRRCFSQDSTSPRYVTRVPVDFDDLVLAYEFANTGVPYETAAFLCVETGEFHYQSDDIDEEVPEDIDCADKYIRLPLKNDLGLGSRLVFDFAHEMLPDDVGKVHEIFSRKGAYSSFKDWLDRRGMLQAWHDYEEERKEKALRSWCERNGVEIRG